jgi:UDP:flavonoid glycosyltransferase YjiC (YdhE family)
MNKIAFFVTPHGFGHAARSAAVMEALLQRVPALHFEIFTQIPEWFFKPTLGSAFTCHPVACDVGFVQPDALTEDLPATLRKLADLIPFRTDLVSSLAQQVESTRCRGVICDIASLGIAVAQTAGIPSILQENFTWGWIYAGHFEQCPALRPYAEALDEWCGRANWRIRTEPACDPASRVDLIVPPVSRPPRQTRAQIREELGIQPDRPTVLLTMGGMNHAHAFYGRMAARADVQFVIPGETAGFPCPDNLLFLERNSGHYHPDLVGGMDAVIGKAGYSTLAEVYRAGLPFACVLRPGFRESRVLESYVNTEMKGFCLSPAEFSDGQWLDRLDELLALTRYVSPTENGVDQVAEFVLSKLQVGL